MSEVPMLRLALSRGSKIRTSITVAVFLLLFREWSPKQSEFIPGVQEENIKTSTYIYL